MKKLLLLALSTTLGAMGVQAQTLTLKPGPAVGEDAIVMNTYGCTPGGYPGLPATLSGGVGPEIQMTDWTYNAAGCAHGTTRTYIRFTGLGQLPAGATVTSATLKLYGIPNGLNPPGNSTYPESPYSGTNEGWVQRATGAWNESTLCWNNQPTVTTVNQVAMPITTSQWNSNLTLNVTTLVNDIIASGSNQGFRLLLQNEAIYRSRYYASSDHPDSTKWPELIVAYTLPNTPPCNLDFAYGASAGSPYKYTFIPPAGSTATTWSINGVPLYSNTSVPVTHSFAGPGSYSVCLKVRKGGQEQECTKCINLCIADNGRKGTVTIPKEDGGIRLADQTLTETAPLKPEGNSLRMERATPNPTHTSWTANIISATAVQAEVALYDFTGRLMQQFKADLAKGHNRILIDAQKLPANSYLLRVTADANTPVQTTLIKY